MKEKHSAPVTRPDKRGGFYTVIEEANVVYLGFGHSADQSFSASANLVPPATIAKRVARK